VERPKEDAKLKKWCVSLIGRIKESKKIILAHKVRSHTEIIRKMKIDKNRELDKYPNLNLPYG